MTNKMSKATHDAIIQMFANDNKLPYRKIQEGHWELGKYQIYFMGNNTWDSVVDIGSGMFYTLKRAPFKTLTETFNAITGHMNNPLARF